MPAEAGSCPGKALAAAGAFFVGSGPESEFERKTAIARQAEKRNRLNGEISAREVRLIGQDGEQVGIVPLDEAIRTAEGASLDLVEIVPNADPPVCRIMDYGKFVFEQKKQKQEARKKQKQVQVKEVKFRPGTDIGDYQVKLRNLRRFLEDGDKAKVTMRFRGREHAHRDRGLELLEKIEADLQEISQVEQRPMMEGRQMVMVLGPRKNK
jgi:translation initiation factor IF-3